MNLSGSAISFPFRVDARGSIITTDNPADVLEQAIIDVIETRLGERVMVPAYGIPDFVFSAQDAGFAARLSFRLEDAIKTYVPLVESVTVKVSTDDQGRSVAEIRFTEVGSINAPRNMVYPVWKYIGGDV